MSDSNMNRRDLLRYGAVGSAAALAGCALIPGGGDGTTTIPATTQLAQGYNWNPIRLSVEPGTTVTFQNTDQAAHTVTASQLTASGTSWDADIFIDSGTEKTHTFDEPGVYQHYDTAGFSGGDKSEMCGVVLVGDNTQAELLPCEASPNTPKGDQ